MEIKRNFLDRAIGVFSPKMELQRLKYRAMSSVAEDQIRRYTAATKGRRTDGWTAGGTSANTEIGQDLVILRDRSRDLDRNQPFAKKAIRAITTNTVGLGIQPAPEGSKNDVSKVKTAWKSWAETTDCDFAGQMNFYGLQSLIMRTVALSGEALVIRRRRNAAIPIQLQVVEGDFLDHTKNEIPFKGGAYIMQGVEFDAYGRRVAYWLYQSHPAEGMAHESKRVPAEDVLHIYEIERPGQVRGVPMGAASMLRLKDFDDYEDAQLTRQKIASCFSVFITNLDGDDVNGGEDDVTERVEPGMIYHVKPGEDVKFITPPAMEGYAEYSRSVMRGVAAGYGTTYEATTGDLTGVNFSSGRMGWLEFQRQVEQWQMNMLVPMLCNKVFGWLVDSLKMTFQISPGAKVSAGWTPPRREMIQPKEEIEAKVAQVRAGLCSWQEAVRELGFAPEDIINELVAAKKLFDDNKLVLTVDASHNLVKTVSDGTEEKPKPPKKKPE